jgi:hypothetical protein
MLSSAQIESNEINTAIDYINKIFEELSPIILAGTFDGMDENEVSRLRSKYMLCERALEAVIDNKSSVFLLELLKTFESEDEEFVNYCKCCIEHKMERIESVEIFVPKDAPEEVFKELIKSENFTKFKVTLTNNPWDFNSNESLRKLLNRAEFTRGKVSLEDLEKSCVEHCGEKWGSDVGDVVKFTIEEVSYAVKMSDTYALPTWKSNLSSLVNRPVELSKEDFNQFAHSLSLSYFLKGKVNTYCNAWFAETGEPFVIKLDKKKMTVNVNTCLLRCSKGFKCNKKSSCKMFHDFKRNVPWFAQCYYNGVDNKPACRNRFCNLSHSKNEKIGELLCGLTKKVHDCDKKICVLRERNRISSNKLCSKFDRCPLFGLGCELNHLFPEHMAHKDRTFMKCTQTKNNSCHPWDCERLMAGRYCPYLHKWEGKLLRLIPVSSEKWGSA